MRTYSPKADDIDRAWHVVDADGLVLGRLATEVARILRGKHKPIFAPHIDTGDHVVVVNAAKVVMTRTRPTRSSPTATAATPAVSSRSSYADLLERTARRGGAPGGPGHAARRTPSAASSWPSSRSTPAPTTPTPPRSPSRSTSPHGPPPGRLERQDAPCPHPSPRPPAAASRPWPASASGPGQGTITVNREPFEEYFPSATHRMLVTEPLRVTNTDRGLRHRRHHRRRRGVGPGRGLRLGIARALVELDPELRAALKRAGLLTRDAREKESKKYGLKKARKAPQYSKR